MTDIGRAGAAIQAECCGRKLAGLIPTPGAGTVFGDFRAFADRVRVRKSPEPQFRARENSGRSDNVTIGYHIFEVVPDFRRNTEDAMERARGFGAMLCSGPDLRPDLDLSWDAVFRKNCFRENCFREIVAGFGSVSVKIARHV